MESIIQRYMRRICEEQDWRAACTYTPIRPGASGAGLYLLAGPQAHEERIVKIVKVDGDHDSQKSEVALYKWLEGQVLVPKVYDYFEWQAPDATYEILVMSALKGQDLKSQIGQTQHSPEKIAYRYGQFLSQLHRLDIQRCPVSVPLDLKLQRAQQLMAEGSVDAGDFEADFAGVPAAALLDRLRSERPAFEDLVVTHGDYCLDNLMVEMTEDIVLTGFIDLGMGGVQDRYQDLALAVRSIRKKLGEACVADFVRGYGLITALDESKIQYYIMMDEFF